MNALKINEIRFAYTAEDVLKKISFEVPKGSFVSILGPNGSGKTTLLKSVSHVLKPYAGEVMVQDKNIKKYGQKDLAKSLAVVHQTQPNDFDFTVEDVVLMGRYPYLGRFQSESSKDYDIATKAMTHTSVLHLKDKSIQHISGGERQRVMIARALTQEADTLLLDEPISHLDIKYQLEVLNVCKALTQNQQMTVVTTLHDINMASRFSDFIILMKNGEIIEMGAPNEVINKENIQRVYEVDVEIIQQAYPLVVI